jgi:hypothetical protein
VLQGVNLDPELFAQAHQHNDLIGAVAVRVDIDLQWSTSVKRRTKRESVSR